MPSGALRYASKVRARRAAQVAHWGGPFDVEVEMDLDPAERTIAEMLHTAEDWRDVWPEVGEWYATRQRRVFETRSFGRWAPLRAATLVRKRAEGSTQTLVETGSLLRMVSSDKPRTSAPRYAVFGEPTGGGETAKYGRFHARGTGSMPQRNPIPNLTSAERIGVMRVVREAFLARVEAARAGA